MFIEYAYWHYVVAARWLATFIYNLQRALIRIFSVPTMLRTLFSHWRKDVVSYRAGGLGNIIMTFAWNQISRLVGFFIRSIILSLWLVLESIFILLVITFSIGYVAWPLLVILTVVAGAVIMIRGNL